MLVQNERCVKVASLTSILRIWFGPMLSRKLASPAMKALHVSLGMKASSVMRWNSTTFAANRHQRSIRRNGCRSDFGCVKSADVAQELGG